MGGRVISVLTVRISYEEAVDNLVVHTSLGGREEKINPLGLWNRFLPVLCFRCHDAKHAFDAPPGTTVSCRYGDFSRYLFFRHALPGFSCTAPSEFSGNEHQDKKSHHCHVHNLYQDFGIGGKIAGGDSKRGG